MAPGKLTLATLIVTGPRAATLSGPGHNHGGSSGGHTVGHGQTYFLRYGLNRRTDVGLGYWSRPGKPRPSINWQAARERMSRPGVVVGYGSEPMGEWRHDGAYVSLIKGLGGSKRRTQAFAAYFREIDGETNHLIGGLNHSLGARWSLFAGRYPFNSWQGAATYQLPNGTQLGLWAHDFGRKPRLGVSVGVGWQIGGRKVTPPPHRLPDEAKQAAPEEPAQEARSPVAGTAVPEAAAPSPEPAGIP